MGQSAYDKWLEAPYHQLEDEIDMEYTVLEAIKNNDAISYGNGGKYTIKPFESNDLGDKVNAVSGQLLLAYSQGDNDAILRIMHKLCEDEVTSLIDLIYG